ncbi:MAG: nuclear transport factor 2 family protein [Gammaproteobacteria bacterium]|nr:nuclear transport factor 2 family protein [Gammaproteobacteria bacterium]
MSLVEDKEALREVVAKYCHYVDSGNIEAWLDLFTEDAVFDGGAKVGMHHGKAAFRVFNEHITATLGPMSLRHSASNFIISVVADRAHLSCYITVFHRADTGVELLDVAGYEMDLIKHDGHWLIKHLLLTPGLR